MFNTFNFISLIPIGFHILGFTANVNMCVKDIAKMGPKVVPLTNDFIALPILGAMQERSKECHKEEIMVFQ